LQEAAVQKVAAAALALGLEVSPAFPSPLKGPKGNQEYFLHVIRPEAAPDSLDKPRA
jgi:predicted rRNA methylase YqxC with S4 and FtsJ domains